MKRISFAAIVAAFLLAACGGSDEPAAPQTDTMPDADDAVAVMPATDDTSDAATDENSQPEMVEESAAQEDAAEADDQPIVLAQAPPADANREWKFKEGVNFTRMVPTQPTVGGADKIEVAEIFWYGCNHCYDFEPFVARWLKTKPADVRFVRIPAMWNPLVKLHGQLYYTEQVLVSSGKIANPEQFRAAIFAEYHRRQNRMASVDAIQDVFERQGVSPDDFRNAWGSFEVSQKMRIAEDLGRRYAISGVPTIVVNGKYRTGSGEAGGYPRLLELMDELVERERLN